MRALLLVLAATSAHALVQVEGETAGAELMGSARSFGLFMDHPFFEGAVVLDRLRLGSKVWWGEHLALEVAGDGVATIGRPEGFGTLGTAVAEGLTLGARTPLRLGDVRRSSERGNTVLSADLDRAALSLRFERFELRVGRQAISHGSGRLFPVTDVFAPFSGVALDTEYKPGIDAARLTVPLGERAEVEAYAVAHEDGVVDGVHLARARYSFDGLDVSAFAGTHDREPIVALDLQGDLGGLGWYAEALSQDAEAPSATLGGMYHFALGLTVFVEGHRSVGVNLPEGWYAGAGATYELSPLVFPALSALVDLDGSALLSASLRWDAGQEVAVDVGALRGFGDDTATFGASPDIYFASVRLYF